MEKEKTAGELLAESLRENKPLDVQAFQAATERQMPGVEVTVTQGLIEPKPKFPFEEPIRFGETGDQLAADGSLPVEEAVKQMNELHEKLTSRKRYLRAEHLSIAYIVSAGDDWQLVFTKPVWGAFFKVWVSEEGEGEEPQ